MKQFFAGFACALALVAVPVTAAVKIDRRPPMPDWQVWTGKEQICQGIIMAPNVQRVYCMTPLKK